VGVTCPEHGLLELVQAKILVFAGENLQKKIAAILNRRNGDENNAAQEFGDIAHRLN
jgi:hypothetical protein